MKPKDCDAVFGGQTPSPVAGAVLGGIAGIKQKLTKGTTEQKIDALLDSFDCGQAGLDLVIAALEDKSREVRSAAYWLLEEKKKEVLWNYLPYASFECLHTIDKYGEPGYFSIISSR